MSNKKTKQVSANNISFRKNLRRGQGEPVFVKEEESWPSF
jgi:hypothetical protein